MMMTTLAVAPEGVLLKKQYLKPILTAVCSQKVHMSGSFHMKHIQSLCFENWRSLIS